ncbi:MAG: PKD domain-containing protein [Sphingobacteriales bacterium]|nr:PKD domain-containing protein [Sphingobacteriales bacterium]
MRILYFYFFAVLFSETLMAQKTTQQPAEFTTSSFRDTVRFHIQVSEDSATERHLWLFGDGRISELNTPVHVYDECGVYKVKHFRIKLDKDGAVVRTDSFFTDVKTACPMVCDVKPSFKWQQYKYDPLTEQLLGGTTVLFTNTTPGGLPKGAKFNWYVDGQSYSRLWDPRIDFPNGGHFTVCLQITLPNGCETQYCARINVADL